MVQAGHFCTTRICRVPTKSSRLYHFVASFGFSLYLIQNALQDFSVNCTGQSAPWVVKGLFTKPKQFLGQESIFVNCEDATDTDILYCTVFKLNFYVYLLKTCQRHIPNLIRIVAFLLGNLNVLLYNTCHVTSVHLQHFISWLLSFPKFPAFLPFLLQL